MHTTSRFTLVCTIAALLPGCHTEPASDGGGTGGTSVADGDAPDTTTGTDDRSSDEGDTTATGEPGNAGEPEACIVLPAVPGLQVVDAGERPLGQDLCLRVEDGVEGFTVLAFGDDQDIRVAHLRSPAGDDVVRDGHLLPSEHGFDSLRYSYDGEFGPVRPAVMTMGVPQSPAGGAMPLLPGDWQLRLVDSWLDSVPGAPVLEIAVRGPALHAEATVDVNLFLAPGVSDEASMQETVTAALELLGLRLGRLTHHPLPASATVVDADDELFELQGATRTADDSSRTPALNIIAVRELNGGLLDAVIGISPGVPGATFHHGTPVSAVALEITQTANDVPTLAHEIGHFAGLFHTTEQVITGRSDPLADTPECMTPEDVESCPDRSNLMFWGAGLLEQSGRVLTEQQRAVLQASALHRGGSLTHDDTAEESRRMALPRLAAWAKRVSPATRAALGATCSMARPSMQGLSTAELTAVARGPDTPLRVRRRALRAIARAKNH